MRTCLVLLLAATSALASPAPVAIEERSLTDVAADLAAGRATSEDVTRAYLDRIALVDGRLHSIIALDPSALDQARASDARRRAGASRGPLDGVPILLKDNIESRGVATTAGSLALKDNVPQRDAPLVARLRDAGAVILGKTNLSEWANIRSTRSTSGWSAVGGLTRNPHALDRNPCGSSSGSGSAVAASLAAAAIGTETDGSITCPSAVNGIVGLKPTVGLVSRRRVIPISHSQDTAGPMARSVADAAAVLTAIAGTDPGDPATRDADAHRADYAKGLDVHALRGARLGVLRFLTGYSPATDAAFEKALAVLRAHDAVLVEIPKLDTSAIDRNELPVLLTELKAGLDAYLATTDPATVRTRTLADVIAFDAAEPRETAWFGQELFEQAQATKGLTDPAYLKSRETSLRSAGREGIDKLLRDADVIALVAPTTGPAWTTDPVNGDHYSGSATTLPAVAGYPHLTVPMGDVAGLPVGLSFIGPAWSEARLLSLGHAFEQATRARRAPSYAASIAGP